MSLGFGFGSGLRALSAARLGMQTAGNNIANANTVGYSRQRVSLSAALPYQVGAGFQIGSGVEVNGIFGVVDEGLQRRIQMQQGLVGGAEVDHLRYQEIEGILAEPDGGLSESLRGLFGAIGSLQTDPADRALRGGVVQAGSALSQDFRLMASRLGDLSGSTFDEVRGLVREVNAHAEAIAELNRQIVSLESNGSLANDLRDTRGQHIQEIGKLLDTRAIERATGSVDLLVGGHLLVAGGESSELAVGKGAGGLTRVTAGKTATATTIREGRIAALLRQEQQGVPEIVGRIDELARNTILEINRLHSTGMPRSGPFRTMTSNYGAGDTNGTGNAGDELLSQAGFEFDVADGALYIAVSRLDGDEMARTRIDIDADAMTLQDVAAAITAIDHLAASIDPTGRLRINADSGYGFDFSTRIDPNPDGLGSFGGKNPSIGSPAGEPYDLSGQTFPVTFTVTTGTAASPVITTVTLQGTDFANAAQATADELVAAINDDLGTAGHALNVGGRLVIQSAQGGGSSQLTLADLGGTALAGLGMSTATAIRLRARPVARPRQRRRGLVRPRQRLGHRRPAVRGRHAGRQRQHRPARRARHERVLPRLFGERHRGRPGPAREPGPARGRPRHGQRRRRQPRTHDGAARPRHRRTRCQHDRGHLRRPRRRRRLRDRRRRGRVVGAAESARLPRVRTRERVGREHRRGDGRDARVPAGLRGCRALPRGGAGDDRHPDQPRQVRP